MWNKRLTPSTSIKAHTGWITSISVAINNPKIFVTGSRDYTILVWEIFSEKITFALLKKRLSGHSHFVSELVLSPDAKFCISASWDGSLRLWDIESSKAIRKFVGHKKGIMSVSFSKDNRLIISGSMDKSIKLWNTLGECKNTFIEKSSPSWVSCVRFMPGEETSILSCHWDGTINIWKVSNNQNQTKLSGHKGYINFATISPDSSLCASGGKDGDVILWDIREKKYLFSLDAGEAINSLCFSPNKFWLCGATQTGIKVWNLETKEKLQELFLSNYIFENANKDIGCLSMAWTVDGLFFLTGYVDGFIRVWSLKENTPSDQG